VGWPSVSEGGMAGNACLTPGQMINNVLLVFTCPSRYQMYLEGAGSLVEFSLRA
jgi:hypothetical protein